MGLVYTKEIRPNDYSTVTNYCKECLTGIDKYGTVIRPSIYLFSFLCLHHWVKTDSKIN